jgi:hypothetical protein
MGVGVALSGLARGVEGFSDCDCAFTETVDGEGLIVGVDGPECNGVASPALVTPGLAWLLVSGLLYRRDLGTNIEARRRTVRWCASVAAAFKLRKNKYWTMTGARERKVVASDGSFSIRAQVR